MVMANNIFQYLLGLKDEDLLLISKGSNPTCVMPYFLYHNEDDLNEHLDLHSKDDLGQHFVSFLEENNLKGNDFYLLEHPNRDPFTALNVQAFLNSEEDFTSVWQDFNRLIDQLKKDGYKIYLCLPKLIDGKQVNWKSNYIIPSHYLPDSQLISPVESLIGDISKSDVYKPNSNYSYLIQTTLKLTGINPNPDHDTKKIKETEESKDILDEPIIYKPNLDKTIEDFEDKPILSPLEEDKEPGGKNTSKLIILLIVIIFIVLFIKFLF